MSVEIITDIILNSFLSWLFIPVGSEINWFARLAFSSGDMLWPTVAAVLGGSLGIMASYLLGWVAALDVKNMPLSEEKYQRASRFANNVMLWFLLIPWWPFYAFFALIFGFLHVCWWRLLFVVLASRLIYYGFYLYH